MSPRKFAKAVLFHARRAHIRALAAPRHFPWLRRRLHLPANEIFDPLVDASPHVRVVRLEPGDVFQRPMPAMPDAPPAATAFFATRVVERTAPAFVAELTQGVAWGHPTGGIFTADHRFVPAFTHDPSGADLHTVWTRWHLPPPRRLPGRTLYLVTPEATDNFHHWVIDLLPRLGQVCRAGYQLGDFDHVIVNHRAFRFQRSTLTHLGIDERKLIVAEPSLLVRADTLVVPSLKSTNQSLPAADVTFLREAFLGRSAPRTGHRRLFLSRGDAAYRRLLNERDFHPLLLSRGFEIVEPARLDFLAQARLFSEAAVIAGPAGAAFANLAFVPSGARVLEWVNPQWIAAFHWMISARAGLAHTVVLGDGPVMRGVPDSSAREKDIVVSRERFTAALAAWLDEPVLAPAAGGHLP